MRFVAGLMAMASVAAFANTGTVTAELSGDESAFNVSFANHAHETNSLWVVYDGFDYGHSTNGWGHVERLGMVTPETNTWTYAAPAGWGETVRAIRFILSEVPYDYDYSLDFIRSTGRERLCLTNFVMNCAYRVCCVVKMYKVDGRRAGRSCPVPRASGCGRSSERPFSSGRRCRGIVGICQLRYLQIIQNRACIRHCDSVYYSPFSPRGYSSVGRASQWH